MAKEKSKGGVWRVVYWVALVVCVCALAVLGFIFYSYWSANKGYEDIAKAAFDVDDTKAVQLSELKVDWDYLRSINSDVVAWVYMPGTNINYPVCQTDNNETYLVMDFNQKQGFSARCGTIFLDYENKSDFSDENNVLYGHHMNDGSMFACISKQLVDNGEFNANRTIYVLTPEMNYQCETFSIVITDGWEALVETTFKDQDAMTEYIQDKESRSVVTPSEGMPDASKIEKLFTFSTCDYTKDNGRAVMFSRMVDSAVPGSGEGELVAGGDVDAMQDAQEAA